MKISFVLGTRPEAIKLAPLIKAFQSAGGFEVDVCSTGQHKEMLYQVLDLFDIKPNVDLQIMKPNQTLAYLTAAAITELDKHFIDLKPGLVICQGDTTTAYAAAMAAFYNKIQVGHVEAGLRTFNKWSPFPEEMNRVLISRLADYHFAPTELSAKHLYTENIENNKIFQTGNTVIDALYYIKSKLDNNELTYDKTLEEKIGNQKFILVTGHRRENFGEGFLNICFALKTLAQKYPEIMFVYPVHLNPNVKTVVNRELSGINNIILHTPLDYVTFISIMSKSYLVLTDSGGVQEEAPGLGKPVLVMRENAERPEAIMAGTAKLIGTNADSIVNSVVELIENKEAYKQMAKAVNPYGDGKACERIVNIIKQG